MTPEETGRKADELQQRVAAEHCSECKMTKCAIKDEQPANVRIICIHFQPKVGSEMKMVGSLREK